MRLLILISMVALTLVTPATAAQDPDQPYYFLAIHNEPFNGLPDARIADSYDLLRQMVQQADAYHIKLTLMFSAQWADFIAADETRAAEVAAWAETGHEIAAHHHSIYHGNWDGYTNYARDIVELEAVMEGRLLAGGHKINGR